LKVKCRAHVPLGSGRQKTGALRNGTIPRPGGVIPVKDAALSLAAGRRCVTIAKVNKPKALWGLGSVAAVVQSGEILALAGMGVLLLNNLGRRRVRQGRPPAIRGLAKWLAYGDFVAFGLILAGLVVMYLQK
jgi:hypothetical protein